jgi:methylmalonyl-CoA mutase cobalamin-binding subunit
VGGIISLTDACVLESKGVGAVFAPKDVGLAEFFDWMIDVIRSANGLV